MQSNLTPNLLGDLQKQFDLNIAMTEIRGKKFELGAPVTCSTSINNSVAVGCGDGTIRFLSSQSDPFVSQTHDGVVLCMTKADAAVLTGGDDGRLKRTSVNGEVEEIASFGTKWVDSVAASNGTVACSSERNVHLWSDKRETPIKLEHQSSVGGLAFDASGRRLAVSHYGGVTIWERTKRRWKSTALVWKGFHGAVSFSPDGKYIITAMQENALHGWRLRDKGHLAMSGYPAKVKSFAWVGETPFLTTSGADSAVCWPFDGKFGPMERSPVCVAQKNAQISTYVQGVPGQNAVFVGYKDGSVLLAGVNEHSESLTIRNATGVEVTTISTTQSASHILIGDAQGNILWAPLGQEIRHARYV